MKRTTEEVATYFKNQNCELLDEYKGCVEKMKYRCRCGRESMISWNKFSQGKRCGWCVSKRIKKYTIEEVRQIFEKRGCELKSDIYVGCHNTLMYTCSCGFETTTTLANFKHYSKYNCVNCAAEHCKLASKCRKLKQTDVEQEFQDSNCKLIDEYKNISTPVRYICKCGKKSSITLTNFRQGKRCGKCGSKRAVKFDLQEVKQIFIDAGCEFLDAEYVNSSTLHNFKCSCGEIDVIKVKYFRRGVRCSKCKKANRSGTKHFAWRADREAVELDKSFRKRVYAMIRRCYKKLGTCKENQSHEVLGYTAVQLMQHITSFSEWEHIKNGDWQIDHIFPIKAFLDHNIKDIKIINCLENLQPLLMLDNYSKHDKYDVEVFLAWVKMVS